MNNRNSTTSGDGVIEMMIELAGCSKFHRIILSGPKAAQRMFELHRRGYGRLATTTTCGLPRGQYDVALVDWPRHSARALKTTLEWLVHFLAPTSVLVICISSHEAEEHRKLGSTIRSLGFRVEAGTRFSEGIIVSARRRDANAQVVAA